MTYTDAFLIDLLQFFAWARWLLLAAFSLTIADLKFGISAAKYRKEEIKRSRMIRRTANKIVDYIIWIVIAYTLGRAIGEPFKIDLLPIIILLVIYGIELESIYTNYFASKGKKVKVSVFKFFKKKHDIIEVEEEEK